LISTSGSRAEKVEDEKGRNKTGRNPLKLQETAKSLISLANDFNSLRGAFAKRFHFASEISHFASEIFASQANLPAGFRGYDDSKDSGVGL
jgi:hypothetical protein